MRRSPKLGLAATAAAAAALALSILNPWLSISESSPFLMMPDPCDKIQWQQRQQTQQSTVNENKRFELHGQLPPVEEWLLHDTSTSIAIDGNKNNNNDDSDGDVKIPRTIYKVFLQKGGGIANEQNLADSGPLYDALLSWKRRNPGYTVTYFDLQACRAYLARHYNPVFLRAFDCIQPFANKADLFRYALLYREGGWYSDWKQDCLVDGLLDRLSARGIEWVGAWDDQSGQQDCMQNGFLGASPRHPTLAAVMQMSLENIHDELHKGKTFPKKTALHQTGPCALGAAWKARNVSKTDSSTWTAHCGDTCKFGAFDNWTYHLGDDGKRGESSILHKCSGCGTSQNWDHGNNYNTMFKLGRYYCEDAQSIFGTSPDLMTIPAMLQLS